jgi:DNA-binding NarL/FixJ family response regulator
MELPTDRPTIRGMSPTRTNGNGQASRSRDPITVVIADDHRSFGEALQIALDKERDLNVIEVVEDGADAVRSAVDQEPDVMLLDLRMPGVDGIEATRRLRDEGSRSAVIILTGDGDDVSLARAIQAGARGCLQKTATVVDVADAVRRAHRGEPLHRPAEVNRAIKAMRARSKHDQELERRVERLTPRELEILQAMSEGLVAEEISERLGVSRHTLRTHTQNILTKLGVHSKTDAVVAAIRFGKATPPGLAVEGRDVLGATDGGLEHVV